MKERDFQKKFTRWAKDNVSYTAAFELKITKTKSLPFSALKPHQERNLFTVKHHTLYYKIPDVGYDQKPFDFFSLSSTDAFVVVMFYSRGVKHFYMIDIDAWLKTKTDSVKKSLSESDCARIGERYDLSL